MNGHLDKWLFDHPFSAFHIVNIQAFDFLFVVGHVDKKLVLSEENTEHALITQYLNFYISLTDWLLAVVKSESIGPSLAMELNGTSFKK